MLIQMIFLFNWLIFRMIFLFNGGLVQIIFRVVVGANHESHRIVGGRTNPSEKYPCQIFHIFPKSRNKNPPNKFGNHQLLLMEEIRLTTCYIWNPMNNGIFSISTGAGFLPSPVGPRFSNNITHWAARGFSKCKYFIPIKPYGLTLQSAWISEVFSRVFPILHAISLAHMGCTSLTFLFSKRDIFSTNWPSCSASFQCASGTNMLCQKCPPKKPYKNW